MPTTVVVARKLVEHRLAACVNIVKNIESIYEWKDKIEQDSEVLMIIKSNSQKSADLAKFVQDNHPYDCPEVVTVRVDSGSKPYLEWIHETINKEPLCAQK
uniref:Protein CutA n=1 Tax=Aceria tosichella TaxID=561515 RepID=A0A6G1SCZ1_9ACAR